MPRTGRIEIQNYYYHIVCRGQRKDKIFLCKEDMDYFIVLLKKTLHLTDIELYAYCIMSNHYHLLIKRNKDKIEKFLRILNTGYAVYFNRKYKLTGHVFQDRAKSYIILNEKYLYTVVNYIHNNPAKKGFIKDSCEYKYSSAMMYKMKSPDSILKYVNEGEFFDYQKFLNKKDEFLGDKKDFLKIEKRKKRINKKFKQRRANEKSIKRDFSIFSKSMSKDNPIKLSKQIVAKELYKKGYTLNEIAVVFARSKNTISRWIAE